MDDPEAAIKRLLNLPSVINWARHNKRRLDDTRRRLFAFAIRPPRHSLKPVGDICANLASKKISLGRATELIDQISRPVTRIAAREIIPAFAHEAGRRNFEAVPELRGFEIPYPIGRNPDGKLMLVPIRPTFVLIENEKLRPVFMVGWATLKLDDYQKQLISSIICRSLLTHQNFLDSDAEILCFPRIKGTKVRQTQTWTARAYDILSEDNLREQFERYSTALQQVIRRLRGE
jgi:hypothetical protein